MADPLTRDLHPPSTSNYHHRSLSLPSAVTPTGPATVGRPLPLSISATHSPINPFFGYPIEPNSMNPRHGRRRKRDLFATLALLWWTKWKKTVMWWALAGVVVLIMRKRMVQSWRLKTQKRLILEKGKLADPLKAEKFEQVGETIKFWRDYSVRSK